MTLPKQLRLLQSVSGLTQATLAVKLGVSFVTLNRWMNGKAVPRHGAQERIDALLRSYTGLVELPGDPLRTKKAALVQKAAREGSVLATIMREADIRDQLVLVLTYTSNRIEGSTLTEEETAAVIFRNVALPHKTLTEQLEAKNHQTALEYLFTHLNAGGWLDEAIVLHLHGILMNGIREDAGRYRQHGVRIVGANVPTANHLKVPVLMATLIGESGAKEPDTIRHVSSIHSRFEQIHPFADGNGRIGRLLMHAMLLRRNYPPAVIQQEKRRLYYAYLQKAQQAGVATPLEEFVCDAVFEGWAIMERR